MSLGSKDHPLTGTAKVFWSKTTKTGKGFVTTLLLGDGSPAGKGPDGKPIYKNITISGSHWSASDPGINKGDTIVIDSFKLVENDYWVQLRVPMEKVKSGDATLLDELKKQLNVAHNQANGRVKSAKGTVIKPSHPLEIKIYEMHKADAVRDVPAGVEVAESYSGGESSPF